MLPYFGEPVANGDLYLCPRCKEIKHTSKFAGTKHVICKKCSKYNSSPKRLAVLYETRLAKNMARYPEQCVPGSKGVKRLLRLIEKNKTRASRAYLSQRQGATLRGKRLHNATPKWISEHHFGEVIAACERENQRTGQKHHLDHIIPLAGKTVSGLHVPWNLQVLDASENCSKGNKLLPNASVCAYPLGDNPLCDKLLLKAA